MYVAGVGSREGERYRVGVQYSITEYQRPSFPGEQVHGFHRRIGIQYSSSQCREGMRNGRTLKDYV